MDSPSSHTEQQSRHTPAGVHDEAVGTRSLQGVVPAVDFIDERNSASLQNESIPAELITVDATHTEHEVQRPALNSISFRFMGWASYQAELSTEQEKQLPPPPESHYRYRETAGLYSYKEMDALSARITADIASYDSFESLRDVLAGDLSLTRLAKTLRSASNDKELLEQVFNLEPMGDLVIRADLDIYSVQQMDSFFARTIASGHRLTVNLALAELYYLADSLGPDIAEDCRIACKQTIESTMGYLQGDVRYDSESNQFIDDEGKPLTPLAENHTLLQHFWREAKELKSIDVLTLFGHDDVKLLATFRAFAAEARQIKDDIGVLLACIYTDEEDGLDNPVDIAIAALAGVNENVARTNVGRFTARFKLTPKIEEAIQGLVPGYENLRETLGAEKSATLDRIIPAMERSLWENSKQAYVGFKNTKAGQIAATISLANAGVALFGMAAAQVAGVDTMLHELPVIGPVTSTIAQPLYRMVSFILFAGLLDKTQDWMRGGDLKRLLARVEPED